MLRLDRVLAAPITNVKSKDTIICNLTADERK